MHYLSAPVEELKRRIAARNATLPPQAAVDPDDLDAWSALFEPPAPDELAGPA